LYDLAAGDCETITVGPEPIADGVAVENTATGTAFLADTATQVGEKSDSSRCESDDCPEGGPTRTPGYWFTHPIQLKGAFQCITGVPEAPIPGIGGTIDLAAVCGCACDEACAVDSNDAMAIFWNIAASNRPTLAQHILAAMFNQCVFGTDPEGDIIAEGIEVLCDEDATAEEIAAAIEPLDEFNNSGTDLMPDPGTIPFPFPGQAAPKKAKQMANNGTVPDCVQ